MPEGHTIHALAARLERAYLGAGPLGVTSPQGRFAAEAGLLEGRELVGAQAAGKHLFVRFEGDAIVHVHLGLIGSFVVAPYDDTPPPAVGAVRLRLVGPGHVADLRGPTLCALAGPEEVDAVLARLGPDPLRPDADPDRAWRRIQASSRPIAQLLMDQAVVAGVGNVYRCEVLFRHRVDPWRPGRELRPATWRALWEDLVTLLPLGVRYGQILTLPEQVTAGLAAYDDEDVRAAERERTGAGLGTTYERAFAVYRRTGEPCPTCGSAVRAQALAGRTLYWCGRCQRRR